MFVSNPQRSEAEQLVYQGCSDSNGSNHSVDDEIVVHPAGDTIGLLGAAAVGQIVSGPGHMVLVIGVKGRQQPFSWAPTLEYRERAR